MQTPHRRTLATIAVLASLGVSLSAEGQLAVEKDGSTGYVTDATLATTPRDTATMVFHGSAPLRYEGYSLRAVLRAAGISTDSLRGPALGARLVIEARDGYRVVLALADLDPSLGARRILLADRVDGKALPADEAPWRLIVVGDQRPTRSARQVVRIRVVTEG
jgi:hypothetical protein